jgi:hypothetical protein
VVVFDKAWDSLKKAQVIPPTTPECPECGKPLTEGRVYNPPDDKGSPCCGWENEEDQPTTSLAEVERILSQQQAGWDKQ